MSVYRLENWLENSPYNQPQDHRRKDMTLKRAATLSKIRRERTELRQRLSRESRDSRSRDERQREDKEKQKEDKEKQKEDKDVPKSKEEQRANKNEKTSEVRQHHYNHYNHNLNHNCVTVVVPPHVRPAPEYKPISRGHVTVDTTKAKSSIDVIRMCIHEMGWREVFAPRREPCDFYWHAISYTDHTDITHGHVNKFPGMQELMSKINLFRALDTMRNLFPSEYDFYPRSWFLPYQFHDFSNEIRQQQDKKVKPKPTYIVKPSEGSQGEGIYLIREPQQYYSLNGRCHIVQEYLSNVFLLEKFKFDLRIYVTLTSVDPLEFYICKEGLARFSTIPYENPTNKNMQEVYMHLTNYSLNKRSSTFNKSDKDEEGSKRKLTSVFHQMKKLGYDTALVWQHIEQIVCKTMVAVSGELRVQQQTQLPAGKPGPRCFQILGFDVLLLHDLKPILLEVNANPSLNILGEQEVKGLIECVPSLKDEQVKVPLVRDTLLLMAPPHKYTRRRRHRPTPQKKRSSDHETAIVIKMDEMDLKDNHQPPVCVKETAIRIFDASMEMDSDKEKNEKTTGSNDKGTDDSDDKTTDDSEHASDSENKMEEETDDEEEEGDEEEQREKEKKKEEEIESCLKKIFPDIYGSEFHYLRLMERLASLFIQSLGVRGATRIGPTAFRTFARKCRLNRRGVTNAAIDILYIDMQRKWDYMNPDRTSGLGFQGFVDACFEISRRKFYLSNRREMLESYLDYCEEGLDDQKREEDAIRRRFARPPRKLARRPVHLFQRSTITSLEEESVQELYENSMARRNPGFLKPYDLNYSSNRKRTKSYQPKPLRLYDNTDDDDD